MRLGRSRPIPALLLRRAAPEPPVAATAPASLTIAATHSEIATGTASLTLAATGTATGTTAGTSQAALSVTASHLTLPVTPGGASGTSSPNSSTVQKTFSPAPAANDVELLLFETAGVLSSVATGWNLLASDTTS